jgi:CheY-like chemotaxis protein
VTEALRFKGYRTVTVADGPAALAAVTRERPNLVLLDAVMPGMDGFEVCRRLKAQPATRDIPLILLTGAGDPDSSRRAFDAGAELALRKPGDTGVILRTVEAALSVAVLRAGPEAHFVDETAVAPDLAVPVQEVPLDFWTLDGASFPARLRLHLQVESHGGPEAVRDRLNDPDLFLSLRLPGQDAPVFLNKIQVIRVDVKATDWAPDFAQVPGEIAVQTVRVQLINGEELMGRLHIHGPAERRRLSDFLNTQPAFLPLEGPDRLHLLQKRFIARVVPAS